MIKSPLSPISKYRKEPPKKNTDGVMGLKSGPGWGGETAVYLDALPAYRRAIKRNHEQQRPASLKKYAELYEFAPVGYVSVSPKGIIEEANLTAAKKLGLKKRAVIGKNLADFCAGASERRAFSKHCAEALVKRKKTVSEILLRRKNGDCFPAEFRSIVSEDRRSKKRHIRTALTDITEEKRAREELRVLKENFEWTLSKRTSQCEALNKKLATEIEEHKKTVQNLARLAAVVESATDAIVITDPHNGTIRYVNKAFTEITGYSKEEAVGNSLHLLDSGKENEQFYRGIREVISREGSWTGQLINKKKDGTLYFELCTYFPLRIPGESITDYVSIKRDITEAVRLASIAEAAADMDNIGFIFSAIRHEIGDPLSTLLVTLEVMKRKLEVEAPETIRKHLNNALQQVARVEYVMTSLKSFNMFENLVLTDVDVKSFMDKFLDLVREDFENKGIIIESSLEATADKAYADTRALQQIMLNLFTNAAVALEGRERPAIKIRVSTRPQLPDHIAIQVEDNGCGMSVEEQKNLFKPFYTTRPRGTGLGMVIIKKMLLKMNGAIEVRSRKNSGTIIDIFIPRGGAVERKP